MMQTTPSSGCPGREPQPAPVDEARRTSPLAFWRYGHDYLRVVRELSGKHLIAGSESQALLHLAAQGVEFALLAFLTANGRAAADVRAEVGRSLTGALASCAAHGLPALPQRWRSDLAALAACHREGRFVYHPATADAFPDLGPVGDAGLFVLDFAADRVAASFVAQFGDGDAAAIGALSRRLRADLSATADIEALRAAVFAH